MLTIGQVGAVDDALLGGGDDLAERHGHGAGAEAVDGVGEDPPLLHAHLQALEVGRRVDGLLAVPEVAEAVVEEEQDLDLVLLLERLVEVLADLAVEHRVGVLVVTHQVRRQEDAHLGEHGRGGADRAADGDVARLDGVHDLELLVQERPAVEDHVDRPVGAPRDLFGHELRARRRPTPAGRADRRCRASSPPAWPGSRRTRRCRRRRRRR